MKTGETYRCRCEGCGEEFESDQIVEVSGVTMGGYGDSWQEFVSPCCHADYEEIGRADMSDKELIDILETRGYAVLKEKEKNDLVTSTLLARLPRS